MKRPGAVGESLRHRAFFCSCDFSLENVAYGQPRLTNPTFGVAVDMRANL